MVPESNSAIPLEIAWKGLTFMISDCVFFMRHSIDATKETGRLGRLLNHSKSGNCHTRLHAIDGTPHLILVASKDIEADEELLYDYGDRSKDSISAHPWLKHWSPDHIWH